ncbi:unnamed protein product [Cylindrotheca closterium]|uniref:Uncharacterized protein n=1 Tax=Cylindrotheca closterium TaxID=2856 RepID=A0AAD2FFV3_9STRA|nr:unnamed protein product [Cylindrotheca closterium]
MRIIYFPRTRFLSLLVLIILLLIGPQAKGEEELNKNDSTMNHHPTAHEVNNTITTTTTTTSAASTTSKETNNVQVFLPTLEVEYICGHDIRPTFNATETFQNLYQTLLPDMQEPQLTLIERITGMDFLLRAYGKQKCKLWGCNTTSPQVLMTFKVKGFASFDRSSEDIAAMNEVINHQTVRSYFDTKVCNDNDLSQFRVFVESPFRKESKSEKFDQVQHHFNLLCDGVKYVYDADEDYDGDPIFVLFGIVAGYYMFRMVAIELQKYGRNIRRSYEGIPSSDDDDDEEVEMI